LPRTGSKIYISPAPIPRPQSAVNPGFISAQFARERERLLVGMIEFIHLFISPPQKTVFSFQFSVFSWMVELTNLKLETGN
jgi:hypothetical protein